ncbi:sigma-54-dependent Fis family transcriptional regulator [Balneolaceae bacterium YR4-1]|uniref:Sigma-54-dependent Fis family transcriptional regulator n=1 Tax=Halalkalibaculum roseum TaxID=2709311 RepID=A0A6M1SVC6_9BACT|nr:sigma-54 dependent transcriptional regulator [Halalkalibaculum roseum]NGP76086.1 sigma-54-dependent Fis family transcriptional regulator [Halalkalibaculum roseum]
MDREAFQERFGLIGESAALKQVIDKIMQVADTDITILLKGESGVGKDITARAIHSISQRKHNDLVIVNCGAIPEGIIESELFGHEKGSFTGAHEAREGYFEKADAGTIFLDEIGDTPKNVQVKLLRVLESGEYFRVGSSKLRTTDVRVIAATNKDLWNEVKEGNFREDLYYRLDTVKIKLPPLRERQDDIIPIFRKFVTEFSAKYDSVFKGFSDDAKDLLVSYRWPGNVRELKNVAEQLVVLEKSQFIDTEKLQKYLKGRQHTGSADNLPVLSRDVEQNRSQDGASFGAGDQQLIYKALVELRSDIGDLKKMLASFLYSTFSGKNLKALPQNIQDEMQSSEMYDIKSDVSETESESLGVQSFADADISEEEPEEQNEFREFFNGDIIPSIEKTEQFLIEQALNKFDGNRRKASEALGISERTLYRKLDQYGLQ